MAHKYLFILLVCGLLLSFHHASAQDIRINEVVSSNNVLLDEEGDSPDWFELYNYGNTDISLDGWTVTDKIDKPKKWAFPDISLPAGGYLPIWASGKDRKSSTFSRTLINQGALVRYHIPTGPIDPSWKNLAFNDSSWSQGKTGIGYADGDDSTVVPRGTISVFLRKKFTISDVSAIQEMILHVDYDDSFIAYVNGSRLAGANVNGNPPAYNATAVTDHEARMYLGEKPDRFTLFNPAGFLQNGENVLCIQVHNVSPTSSDLTLIPFLSAIYDRSPDEGIPAPQILDLTEQWMHTNFKISAAGETLFVFDDNGQLVDSMTVAGIPANVSIGIGADDSSRVYFTEPTPGYANTTHGFEGIVHSQIQFSKEGGHTDTFRLELSGASPQEVIRYTLDARIPLPSDSIYSGPISIQQNTVVRASIFRDGYLHSAVQTHTYLVNKHHDLPVITLVTDPYNFFDNDYGIYVYGDNASSELPHFGANFWEDWERPIHFAFYDTTGELGTSFNAGTKIFGAWSRANDQRSLSIFARGEYGTREINYPFFKELPYSNFQALVLRNSGTDWLNSSFRDPLLTGLMRDTDLSVQAYRPAVAYLNGEYWGIYNIREKVNEHYLASKHGVEADELDILEFEGRIIQGENIGYVNLMNFVRNNTLINQANYQFVADRIDIDNYIMYNLAQIYFDNTDWPGNNVKYWKEPGGKWKWILFDTDFGFGIWNTANFRHNTLAFALETNGPGWPNPPWATLLFRRLCQNPTFRNKFINQFADEMNSRFLAHRVVKQIDSLRAAIASEVPAHYAAWGGDTGYWNNRVNGMRSFANNRLPFVKSHIRDQFLLPAYHKLTIKNETPELGYVHVNSLTIKAEEWEGDYFQSVPITLTVVPTSNWQFSHWEGADVTDSTQLTILVDMKRALTVTPRFIEEEIEIGNIIINEINYQSHPEVYSDDWIELYHVGSETVDLSNWQIKGFDNFSDFVFPEGSSMEPGTYLIITRSMNSFRKIHSEVEPLTGNFGFDYSNEGGTIRLVDRNGKLQDEVSYLPNAPWPIHANGQGPTLELINPTLDNSLPENWASIHTIGSPGRSNQGALNPYFPELKQYPNPFSDEIHFEFHQVGQERFTARLYDLSGAQVMTLVDEELGTGDHHIKVNVSFLSGGLYIMRVKKGDAPEEVKKWVKR